jgi:hypothetical protein
MVYEFSAPACLPTCLRPNAPEECGLPRTESCVCVDKTAVVSGGKCVAAESCGCTDDNGVHRQVRMSTVTHSRELVKTITLLVHFLLTCNRVY